MTLGTGKVYPANKLFALSKYHPVGVMVYNNAELMDVPWETHKDVSAFYRPYHQAKLPRVSCGFIGVCRRIAHLCG